jgi:hypothetical protein
VRKACEIVAARLEAAAASGAPPGRELQVCLIVADGAAANKRVVQNALKYAGDRYALCTVCVGVGAGEHGAGFADMRLLYEGADGAPSRRRVPNFHFVELERVRAEAAARGEPLDEALARECVAGLPAFVQAAKRVGFL